VLAPVRYQDAGTGNVPARTPAGAFFHAREVPPMKPARRPEPAGAVRPVVRRARMTPLPPLFPCAWAVAYGEDRYGLWQAFQVVGVRQVMRWVPPGRFTMGSPLDEAERVYDETPHVVTLKAGFWLADTACTQELWSAAMDGAEPSSFANEARNPVEQVSWNDTMNEFLPRLNARVHGLAAVLPTEAQWEYACRGDSGIDMPFWFGKDINIAQVNFGTNHSMAGGYPIDYRGMTVPVKSLPCNAWGLHQMHGNVWEWCADWYGPYPAGDVTDPAGPVVAPTESARRVLRGGSWIYGARYCRSAKRNALDQGSRYGHVGFRVAHSAS